MAKLQFVGFIGALICLMVACSATVYMVGDTSGWDISSDLDSWATDKRFVVGDVLVFQYSSSDGVCKLTKQQYQKCDTNSSVPISTSGNTTFPLTKPGDEYFACCNQLYCLGGMKLHVHVNPNSTAGPPIGAPEAAPGPAGLLPRTSKNNNPALPSSAEFGKAGQPYLVFLFGFLGYSILGAII